MKKFFTLILLLIFCWNGLFGKGCNTIPSTIQTRENREFLRVPTATLNLFATSARHSLTHLGDEFGSVERRAVQQQIDRAEGVIARGGKSITSVLTGTVKSTYEELLKAGLKAEEKGNSILLKNMKNETVVIIYANKITPIKWRSKYDYIKNVGNESSIVETSDGYWILKQNDDIRIDIGFKKDRRLTAEEVNDFLVNSGRAQKEGQPYLVNTQVEELELKVGEKLYVIENENLIDNLATPNPGGFGTKKSIITIQELREKLAVLENWKSSNLVIREYTVVSPMRVRSGIIGPQLEQTGPNAGKRYPGGAHQYEFINNMNGDNWKKYMKCMDNKGIKLK